MVHNNNTIFWKLTRKVTVLLVTVAIIPTASRAFIFVAFDSTAASLIRWMSIQGCRFVVGGSAAATHIYRSMTFLWISTVLKVKSHGNVGILRVLFINSWSWPWRAVPVNDLKQLGSANVTLKISIERIPEAYMFLWCHGAMAVVMGTLADLNVSG